ADVVARFVTTAEFTAIPPLVAAAEAPIRILIHIVTLVAVPAALACVAPAFALARAIAVVVGVAAVVVVAVVLPVLPLITTRPPLRLRRARTHEHHAECKRAKERSSQPWMCRHYVPLC